MPQRKGWWRSPGCIWSFLADGKKKLHLGGGIISLYLSNSWFLTTMSTPRISPLKLWEFCMGQRLWAKSSIKMDLFLQYGHFYPLPVWHVCRAPKKCLHPPKHVLTMMLNDWCFSLLPVPPTKKKLVALHWHSTASFSSKPIFHTTFNQSPLNSALYGKVAKATPAIKAASSIPTPTHGNWAVTPMKKHQDKDNTNMSSTPTGVWHTDVIRC